jgi:hypothetical protein
MICCDEFCSNTLITRPTWSVEDLEHLELLGYYNLAKMIKAGFGFEGRNEECDCNNPEHQHFVITKALDCQAFFD